MFFVKVGDRESRICFNHSKEEKTLVNKDGVEEKVAHPYKTKCFITDGKAKDKVLGMGVSICSKRDQFNYVTGRKLALGRALKAADFTKEERQEVWEEFLSD